MRLWSQDGVMEAHCLAREAAYCARIDGWGMGTLWWLLTANRRLYQIPRKYSPRLAEHMAWEPKWLSH